MAQSRSPAATDDKAKADPIEDLKSWVTAELGKHAQQIKAAKGDGPDLHAVVEKFKVWVRRELQMHATGHSEEERKAGNP